MPESNVDEGRINEIIRFIGEKIDFRPQYGLILGTGLGGLIDEVKLEMELLYADIPGFPVSTVESHSGKLIFGHLSGQKIVAFSGRFHYYEGYSMQEVTLPVRVMQKLGVDKMILTNAAGGLNESYNAGDIVLIKDHINFFPENPLRGINNKNFGIRFPDMLHAYSPQLLTLAFESAEYLKLPLTTGVYLGLAGPNLETPAEYRTYHNLGADLIGMSSIPEVIVAVHANMDVLAFSIVSNICYPIELIQETTIESVVETVQKSGKLLANLIKTIFQRSDLN